MNRFEIEDIVSQDTHGVIFRAFDTETGETVALRRFLPSGQDGAGLNEDDAAAFEAVVLRFSSLKHESLRSILTGSVDPINGMPFIAAEWIEGTALDSVMADTDLDPEFVIDVLRNALEVSVAVSDALGAEAVWVDTSIESIHVGSQEYGRGITFWVSPSKWLGAEFGSSNLMSIVKLAEQLTGWKGKLVGDRAGHGLGAWLKWLRNNPDSGVRKALEVMDSSPRSVSPVPQLTLAPPAIAIAPPKVKQPSSTGPILIAAGAAFLLAIGALVYFRKTEKSPSVVSDNSEHKEPHLVVDALETTQVVDEPAAAKVPEEFEPNPRKEEPKKPASTDEPEELTNKEVNVGAEAPARTSVPPVLTPNDKKLLSTLKLGTHVKLQGVLRGTNYSEAGSQLRLFFDFSEPRKDGQIRAVARPASYSGKIAKEPFAKMIDKKIVIEGKVIMPVWSPVPLVEITSKDQLKVR